VSTTTSDECRKELTRLGWIAFLSVSNKVWMVTARRGELALTSEGKNRVAAWNSVLTQAILHDARVSQVGCTVPGYSRGMKMAIRFAAATWIVAMSLILILRVVR